MSVCQSEERLTPIGQAKVGLVTLVDPDMQAAAVIHTYILYQSYICTYILHQSYIHTLPVIQTYFTSHTYILYLLYQSYIHTLPVVHDGMSTDNSDDSL